MVDTLHLSEPVSKQPVIKVGGVILRVTDGVPRVLLVQPLPKAHTPDDLPPLGMPRGTRMYEDPATGVMVDANHDGSTLPPGAVTFEPVRETFMREMQEETMLTPPMLEAAHIEDLGAQLFPSQTKEPYPIHWFGVMLDEVAADGLPLTGMKDSLHARWVSQAELRQLVTERKASAGYMQVMEMALQQLGLEAGNATLTRSTPGQSHPETASRSR